MRPLDIAIMHYGAYTALIVTLVILIILSTVSISAIFGENGLIKKAQEAKQHQTNAIAMEEIEMNRLAEEYANIMEGGSGVPTPPADTTGPTVNIEVGTVTDTSIEIKATATDESGLAENDTYRFLLNEEEKGKNTTGEFTFKGLIAATKYTIKVEVKDKVGNLGSATTEVTTSVPTISQSTSYEGYYANLDDDPEPEGVIYADLAVGGSGTGLGQSYNIPKINSGLKSYYVSQTGYAGAFGTKDVLTATGTGEDRFYVMALTDVNSNQYSWYKSAYGAMDEDITATSFGSGKTNTATMMNKWNNSTYGGQNKNDMWGLIGTQVAQGWFVPSRDEWAAFAGELEINNSNYTNIFKLNDYYWSSSQDGIDFAWYAYFRNAYSNVNGVDDYNYVRLSATF